MFVYRYVSIFILTIVYIIGLELNSLAIEPTIENNPLSNQRTSLKDKSIVLAEVNEAKDTEEINKKFYLAGIVLTSITFSFIVFFLFKPEKQPDTEEKIETDRVKPEPIVPIENKATSLAQENKSVIISDKNADLSKSDNRQNITKEITCGPVFSMIGMEEELVRKLILEREIVEITEVELIKPDIVAESPELANSNEPKVNSDPMGKLTIVKSKTTEIDVVFELIQDLQNNSSVNSKKAKDIRRKAIWKLGQTNDFRAVEPLIQIMPRVGSMEKSLILDSIARIANRNFKTINNVLSISLKNESVEVRKNAIKDLRYLYQSLSSVTIRLSKMTEDSNMEVRNTAKWALEQFEKISFPIASIDH